MAAAATTNFAKLSRTELFRVCEAMSKEIAPERVAGILANVIQPNSLSSSSATASAISPQTTSPEETTPTRKKSKTHREFDMSKFPQRKVALWIAYFGENYHGFARNGDGDNTTTTTDCTTAERTVETILFAALSKTRLVDPNKPARTWDYSRCGRTDRGVSALGQVVALRVRSKTGGPDVEGEIDYVATLNRCLPEDVICLAWAPCEDNFNARFQCNSRTYRYVFVKRKEMDYAKMRDAANRFVGTHDFRNFCKMDVENATHFTRTVERVEVVLGSEQDLTGYVEIQGQAFLWHQVRMMMGVLFLCARGVEDPAVISHLFDIEANPRRPTYDMAADGPLVLYASTYPEPWKWVFGQDSSMIRIKAVVENRYKNLLITARTTKFVLDALSGAPFNVEFEPESDHPDACLRGEMGTSTNKAYVPLSHRPKTSTYEEKVDGLSADRKERVMLRKRERVVVVNTTSGEAEDGDHTMEVVRHDEE